MKTKKSNIVKEDSKIKSKIEPYEDAQVDLRAAVNICCTGCTDGPDGDD